MSSYKASIKRANSKGKLAAAVVSFQQGLMHYASESNWAVRGDEIIWVGDDDPTAVAEVLLGKRKGKIQIVRKPDRKEGGNERAREAGRKAGIESREEYTGGNFLDPRPGRTTDNHSEGGTEGGGAEGNGGSPEVVGSYHSSDAGREVRGSEDQQKEREANEVERGVFANDVPLQVQPEHQLDKLSESGLSDSGLDGAIKPPETSGSVSTNITRT